MHSISEIFRVHSVACGGEEIFFEDLEKQTIYISNDFNLFLNDIQFKYLQREFLDNKTFL